jgi:hypothetical protein
MSKMNITFHTNLDEPKSFIAKLNEQWRGPVPEVGHKISFDFQRIIADKTETFSFALEVVAVYWDISGWRPRVELHIPPGGIHKTVAEWSRYYRRHVEGKPE